MPNIAGAVARQAFISVSASRFSVDVTRLSMQRLGAATSEKLRFLAKNLRVMEQIIKESPDALDDIHQAVALKAVNAVIEAYEASVKQERNPSYEGRTNRMEQGALARALTTVATGDSVAIHFMGPEAFAELDAVAKQWARLNFGAGAAGHPSHERFPLDFAGVNLSSIGTSAGPRPAFDMPGGIWFDSDGKAVSGASSRVGQDAFWPGKTGKQYRLPTKGIEAHNFLLAGMYVIATELPYEYSQLINSWSIQAGFGPVPFRTVNRG